jgi:hypothetical protein
VVTVAGSVSRTSHSPPRAVVCAVSAVAMPSLTF